MYYYVKRKISKYALFQKIIPCNRSNCIPNPESRQVDFEYYLLKEYELFLFLARNRGRVYKRDQLLDQVWGSDYEGSDRTVDTHIKTLRLKLKNYGHLIETVWGLGYKFEGSV